MTTAWIVCRSRQSVIGADVPSEHSTRGPIGCYRCATATSSGAGKPCEHAYLRVSSSGLKILVSLVGNEGLLALKQTGQVPWHLVRVLDGIDKRDLADAVLKTQYSIDVATSFLAKYKFRHWKVDAKSGQPVDDKMRLEKANLVATQLASTGRWKEHGHAITRDVAWSELRIEIDHPENVAGFERALRRLWALTHWIFENTNAVKFIMSRNYSHFRLMQREVHLVAQ